MIKRIFTKLFLFLLHLLHSRCCKIDCNGKENKHSGGNSK